MPKFALILSDSHWKWLNKNSNSLRTKSAIIRDLIESEMRILDTEVTLPAYRVGAGKELSKEERKKLLLEEINHPSPQKIFPPQSGLGDGIGREREGTPRKPPFEKIVPSTLKIHEKAILDYFVKKPGEHNKNAWNRLIKGLVSIYEADGHVPVKKQIQQASEEGWRSITFANYLKYKEKPKFQEPEIKHPSYKVFTAKDGFSDEGKSTNELLGGLI